MHFSEANRLRILYFLIFSCTAAWLPIFADYLKERGLKGSDIGTILSVTPLMMFLVQPFYGMLADRIGYKICLIVSSFLAAASYVLYLFEGGFTYLFLITVFMSVFYNSIQPLLDAMALTYIDKNKKVSYGSLRLAGAAGWACTGILAGYFIDRLDTEIIFVFSAVSMILTFAIAFFLHAVAIEKKIGTKGKWKNDIREIAGKRTMIVLMVSVLLVYAASSPVYYFYSIYMKENGASSSLIGFAISFQGLCEIPLFYFSARIISRLGIKTTLLVTVLATALRLFLYSVIKIPELAILIELLHGVAWSLFWVACVEQVNAVVKEEVRATGQSFLYAAMLGAGAIAGNKWTGYLYESEMPVADIYLLNAGIVCVIALLMFVFMRSAVSGTMK